MDIMNFQVGDVVDINDAAETTLYTLPATHAVGGKTYDVQWGDLVQLRFSNGHATEDRTAYASKARGTVTHLCGGMNFELKTGAAGVVDLYSRNSRSELQVGDIIAGRASAAGDVTVEYAVLLFVTEQAAA